MTTEKLKGFSSAFQPWSFFLGDVSWDFVASGATAGHIDDGYFVSALLRCCYAVVQVGANNREKTKTRKKDWLFGLFTVELKHVMEDSLSRCRRPQRQSQRWPVACDV